MNEQFGRIRAEIQRCIEAQQVARNEHERLCALQVEVQWRETELNLMEGRNETRPTTTKKQN